MPFTVRLPTLAQKSINLLIPEFRRPTLRYCSSVLGCPLRRCRLLFLFASWSLNVAFLVPSPRRPSFWFLQPRSNQLLLGFTSSLSSAPLLLLPSRMSPLIASAAFPPAPLSTSRGAPTWTISGPAWPLPPPSSAVLLGGFLDAVRWTRTLPPPGRPCLCP